MVQIPGYRDARPVDAAVFLALSSLVQLAIYELARTPAFRPDPDWIRGALRTDASRKEIGQALLDLVRAGALQEGEGGRLAPNPDVVRMNSEGHRDLQHKLYEDLLDRAEVAAHTEPERSRAASLGIRVPLTHVDELALCLRALEGQLIAQMGALPVAGGPRAVYQVTMQLLPAEVPA